MQINILEAKNRLSELIRTVQSGEEVIIANRGEPVGRLTPVHPAPFNSAVLGSAPGILDWLQQHPLPAYAQRSATEINATIEAERSAWD